MKNTGYLSIDKLHLVGTSLFERRPIIPNISLSNAMDIMNMFNRNKIAISCDELHKTNGDLRDDSILLSMALAELGVKNGDIITIATANLYQPIALFKAANRIGATVTFLNPNAPITNIQKYLNEYESPLFVSYGKSNEYNEQIIKNTKVKQIISLDSRLVNKAEFNESNKIMGYSDIISYHDLGTVSKFYDGKRLKTMYSGKQDALILYTSGSTGEPKSLLFTNENVLAACIYYKNSARLPKMTDDNRKWMGVVPFMYPYGFIASVLATILAKREAIVCKDISAENVAQYYAQKPNLIYGSPAFLELTKRNIKPEQDLSSVQMFVSGGDFLSVTQSQDGIAFFNEHGAKEFEMCNCSGNGEACGCVTNAMNVEYRPETVGKLAIGPDFVVINPDTKEEVKYGEYGVLCIHGKNVFKGYYGNEELTAETMMNFKGKQYYVTGNYGFVDNDSYFHMVGRSSRFYIVSTLNKVYCEHVQKILSSINVVDSCAVVPKPDDEMLYTSKAFIVLKTGIKPTNEIKDYIIEMCKKTVHDEKTGEFDMLNSYEIPTSITFVPTLQRNEADKIDYEGMKEKAREEYELEKQLKKGLAR